MSNVDVMLVIRMLLVVIVTGEDEIIGEMDFGLIFDVYRLDLNVLGILVVILISDSDLHMVPSLAQTVDEKDSGRTSIDDFVVLPLGLLTELFCNRVT